MPLDIPDEQLPESFAHAFSQLHSEVDTLASEILKKGDVNSHKRQKQKNKLGDKLLKLNSSTKSGQDRQTFPQEMHAEAHISEILESDKEVSSSDDEPTPT